MGHLEEVPPDELDNGCENHYYLPHHAVFKESSTTTKLRVVFDGSAKTSSGVSLNDILMIGPVLQPNIFDLLIRFRLYKFGLTADVAKMYRQTALAKKARRFHRLLWHYNPKDEFRHLQLTRVIYGIASSGYHAVRSLQETAKLTDNENVRTAILEGFYVDDFLSGCNTLEDAKGLQDELIATLEKAKLPLRKWVSNDQTLVERLPPDMRGGDLVNLFEADSTVRTLGITWQPQKDHFKFTCTLPKINPPVTKRQILSEIAKLFDPIGWLTPITIKAKIWIQRLWTLGLAWDEPLAENLIEEFKADIKGIEILEKFTLKRFITDCDPVKHEIHCFTDASIHAYSATVYLVTEKATGERISHLIAAKSKVAPIKTVSLPRLELCGAQLGAKLTDKILKAFKSVNLKNLEKFAWTDSTITLAWIQALPSKWNTFVANRVADIQNFIPPSRWFHVPTKSNPADIASRGTHAPQIINSQLWWNGPQFLTSPDQWPDKPIIGEVAIENRKIKPSVYSVVLSTPQLNHEKFSQYKRLRNTQGYVLRFIRQLRSKSPHIDRTEVCSTPNSQRSSSSILSRGNSTAS